MQQQLVQLVRERLRLGQIGDPDGPARHLVLVGRADAATGGADLALAARRLARAVERRVHRQDQRGVLGDPQRGRRHVDALRRHPLDLGQQRLGIDHHAVADDADLAAHQAGRQQRQLVGLVAHHQRVAGVVAALEAHDDVGAAGQPVHHLALALVAPLGADHRDIRHASASSQWDGTAVAQDVRTRQPPRLGRRIVLRRQRRDGGIAEAAHPRSLVLVRTERDIEPLPRLARRRRTQHRVGIQGETGGRFGLAADIAPAAAQFLVPARARRS